MKDKDFAKIKEEIQAAMVHSVSVREKNREEAEAKKLDRQRSDAEKFVKNLPALLKRHAGEDYVLLEHPENHKKIVVGKNGESDDPLSLRVMEMFKKLGVKVEPIFEPDENPFREGRFYLGVNLT